VRVYNGASELISEDDVRLDFPAPVEIVHPSAGEERRAPDLRHARFCGYMRVALSGETVVRKFTGNKCSPKLETFSASHTLLWRNNTAGDYEVYDADCNPKDLLPVVTRALSQGPGATDGTNLCNPVALCASVRLHSCMLICPWRCLLCLCLA
jgi:hypothetical protein